MIGRLRRLRILALFLVTGTPGLGGTALQAVHPCPAEMPWLAGGGEHAHHANGHGAPSDQADTDGCHCIGSCFASAAPALGTSATAIARAEVALIEPQLDQRSTVPTLLPIQRFPPKTAPPSVG